MQKCFLSTWRILLRRQMSSEELGQRSFEKSRWSFRKLGFGRHLLTQLFALLTKDEPVWQTYAEHERSCSENSEVPVEAINPFHTRFFALASQMMDKYARLASNHSEFPSAHTSILKTQESSAVLIFWMSGVGDDIGSLSVCWPKEPAQCAWVDAFDPSRKWLASPVAVALRTWKAWNEDTTTPNSSLDWRISEKLQPPLFRHVLTMCLGSTRCMTWEVWFPRPQSIMCSRVKSVKHLSRSCGSLKSPVTLFLSLVNPAGQRMQGKH